MVTIVILVETLARTTQSNGGDVRAGDPPVIAAVARDRGELVWYISWDDDTTSHVTLICDQSAWGSL